MRFDIEWKTNGAIITFNGQAKSGDLLEANFQLYKSEDYDQCDWTLWDMSEVQDFDISPREAKYSAVTDNATASLSKLSKVILIAKKQEIIETFWEYASVMRHMGNTWEFKVFPDLLSATQWLKAP